LWWKLREFAFAFANPRRVGKKDGVKTTHSQNADTTITYEL
jgi:hypothetical protein